MSDTFSFRVPKGGRAMRKSVALAIDAASVEGVREIVQDPYLADTVYIICKAPVWNDLLVRAAKHSGNERSGDRRAKLFDNGGSK